VFKNILIPVSSEFYSKDVLHRGVFLAEKFKSSITLIYIIEEKTLDQTERLSDTYRTSYEMEETKNEIIKKQKLAAYSIIFDDAEYILKNKKIPFGEKIIEGEFSSVIKRELMKNDYDLIIMSYEKKCLLKYRVLEDVDVPIWVEAKGKGKSILAVCSNLAPNKKVPEISLKLSKALGWNLHMLYIVDVEDSVQVDENGIRSDKKPERDLVITGQNFVQEMKNKGVNIELVKGNLEKETAKSAEKINPNLVIVGREQKKKGVLGLPTKNVKRKIAETCPYSVLFVN